MQKKVVLNFIISTILLIVLFATQAQALRLMSSCGSTNETTRLTVQVNSTGNCIVINQSNILFHCTNASNNISNSISGINSMNGSGSNMSSFGINITNKVNVTIQDCNIQYFAWGIFARNVTNLTLINVTSWGTFIKPFELIDVIGLSYGGPVQHTNSNYTFYNGTNLANGSLTYVNNSNLVFQDMNFSNSSMTVQNSSLNQQGTIFANSTITSTNSNATFNQSNITNTMMSFYYAHIVNLFNSTFSTGTVVNMTNGSTSQLTATYTNSSFNVINTTQNDFNQSTVSNGGVTYYYSRFINFFNSTFSSGTVVNITNGTMSQIAATYMNSNFNVINASQTDFNQSTVSNGGVTYQHSAYVNFFGSNFSARTSVNITNGSISQIETIYRNSSLNVINASVASFNQSTFYNTTSIMRNLASFYMFNSTLEGGALSIFNTTAMAELVNLSSTANALINITTAARIFNSSFENGSRLMVTNAPVTIVDSYIEGYNFTNANVSIFNRNSGELNFTSLITGTNDTNLSKIITITNETMRVNSSVAPYLNTTARVTFYASISDIGNTIPMIDFEDGRGFVACPSDICTNIAVSGSTISFDVTHFTGFGFGGRGSSSSSSSGGGRGNRATSRTLRVIKQNPVLARPKRSLGTLIKKPINTMNENVVTKVNKKTTKSFVSIKPKPAKKFTEAPRTKFVSRTAKQTIKTAVSSFKKPALSKKQVVSSKRLRTIRLY